MEIKIVEVEDGFMPQRASEGAGAYDCYARASRYNREQGYLEVMLGFSIEIPVGYSGKLLARSSVSNRGMMLSNGVGLIDSDFRGEVRARFYPNASSMMAINRPNTTLSDIVRYCENVYRRGEACAQLRIEKDEEYTLVKADELAETKRGEGGFGSTDKKE